MNDQKLPSSNVLIGAGALLVLFFVIIPGCFGEITDNRVALETAQQAMTMMEDLQAEKIWEGRLTGLFSGMGYLLAISLPIFFMIGVLLLWQHGKDGSR